MGDFSMTCSISGLGISGGTPVRCLLLTASPYGREDPRHAWIVRTPPLRAVYDGYGAIHQIHADDNFIADLWLRGLREDLIEKGLGDNQVHDAPASRDMSLEMLVTAVQAGRVEVRQDARHFWRRPLEATASIEAEVTPALDFREIERVLAQDTSESYIVDEPVPHLVRVRRDMNRNGKELLSALDDARAAIERAGFVGVVTAGSGRYPESADLLVFAAPRADRRAFGPRWDEAPKQDADQDKRLPVAMAMVREDVWQTIERYTHAELIDLDCKNCGQAPWYHKDRRCPTTGPQYPEWGEHLRFARTLAQIAQTAQIEDTLSSSPAYASLADVPRTPASVIYRKEQHS